MRYDVAFANAKFIPDGDAYPPRWSAKAEAFRAASGGRLGLRYGPAEAEWFDLFVPGGDPTGLLVFVHGGYWLRFSPRDFSHLAAGAVARGWAVAMPAYTLAPDAHISAMTRQIAAAVTAAAAEVAGPVVITGHSAGGHLSARMACPDTAPDDIAAAHRPDRADLSPLRPKTAPRDIDERRTAHRRGRSPGRKPRAPAAPGGRGGPCLGRRCRATGLSRPGPAAWQCLGLPGHRRCRVVTIST